MSRHSEQAVQAFRMKQPESHGLMHDTKKRRILGDVLSYLFLGVMAIIWLIPIVWVFAESFNKNTAPYTKTFFPTEFSLDNYITLFTDRSVDAIGHEAQMTEARTMGFTILVFAQLFNALSSRSHLQSAFVGLFSNKWLWGAIGLSVALQLVVIYVPFLNGPFGTVALSPMAWVECICLAAIVLIASELRKIVLRAMAKR